MRILALDCGRVTGWALLRAGAITHGSWDFAQDHAWSPTAAGWSLQQRVADAITHYRPDLVLIERPFGASAAAMVESAGLSLAASIVAFGRDVHIEWMHPATVRKVAFGSGRMTKGAVMAAAIHRGHAPANDHEADAIAMLLAWQQRQEAVAA